MFIKPQGLLSGSMLVFSSVKEGVGAAGLRVPDGVLEMPRDSGKVARFCAAGSVGR